MVVIGIDPGAGGAIAVLEYGVLKDVFAMPTDEVKVGKTLRNRLNLPMLANLLHGFAGLPEIHVYIEKVGPAPKDGAAQAFSFGWAACAPVMGCAAVGLPYTLVSPQEWKTAVRCPADKAAACVRASQVFPAAAARFYGPRGGKLDGFAEAALIAYYGAGLTQ